MSIFELSQSLESVNGGAMRYDLTQVLPISGNVSGSRVGEGSASGTTTFQIQESSAWWSPSQSYFQLELDFQVAGAAPVAPVVGEGATTGSLVAYADNFAMTLFSQVLTNVNSQSLDTVNYPHIIDTALTYARAHNNFLKTWGSQTRVGEPLTTRVRNLQTNAGRVGVVFRPPVALFDVKAMPPGSQFQFIFNWAPNGLNAFESIDITRAWGTGANEVSIVVRSFTFYKATCLPDASVVLPPGGVIDLWAANAVQYPMTAGTQLEQTVTLPATTDRILIVFQDTNSQPNVTAPINTITGVGKAYNPATSFTNIFLQNAQTGGDRTFANCTSLSTLYLSLPEIQAQFPQPQYNFGTTLNDYMRAYSDFCHITQGTHDNMEGSIPFGNGVVNGGSPPPVTYTWLDSATPGAGGINVGDVNNPQQWGPYVISAAPGGVAALANTYNQTSRWGWMGRCPGPIFAFPVVRPAGRAVSTAVLHATTLAAVQSMTATVISTYTRAIELQQIGHNLYSYRLIDNL